MDDSGALPTMSYLAADEVVRLALVAARRSAQLPLSVTPSAEAPRATF